jgi:hypothetical protein
MHSNYEASNVTATTSTMPKVPSDGFRKSKYSSFYFKIFKILFEMWVSTMPRVSSDGFRLP